jgi:hypothetical protein
VDRFNYKIEYSRKKAKQRLELMKVDFRTFAEGYIQIALPKAEEKFTTKMNIMLRNKMPSVAISVALMIFSTDLRAILHMGRARNFF